MDIHYTSFLNTVADVYRPNSILKIRLDEQLEAVYCQKNLFKFIIVYM